MAAAKKAAPAKESTKAAKPADAKKASAKGAAKGKK
jgi:hypothetical protein